MKVRKMRPGLAFVCLALAPSGALADIGCECHEPAGAQLLAALDVKALVQMAEGPSARPAQNVRAPAPRSPSLPRSRSR